MECFNDEWFAQLRTHFGVNGGSDAKGLEFLTPEKFSFEKLAHGGGKGGSLMAFSKDRQLMIKELSQSDHDSLLEITQDYAKHLLDEQGSLLARTFVHFRVKDSGRTFMCKQDHGRVIKCSIPHQPRFIGMNNWLPPTPVPATKTASARPELGGRRSSYDLKGTAGICL